MSENEISKPPSGAPEDARALLARLYREIGISAVTAALQLTDLPEAQAKPARQLDKETAQRGDELAA